MTLRDHEVLELLKDEPELLALSDAVAATQARPVRARVHRAVPRAGLVVGVAAAIVLVVLFWPGGGRNGILDRALAAIGNGRVFHLVTQTETGTVLYDLKTGHRTVQTYESEVWTDTTTKRTHGLMRFRGRIVGDFLFPDDANRGGVTFSKVDPAFTALLSGYRKALATGKAKLERRGSIAGHRVFWLAFASVQPGAPGTEVAIDRSTYKPVLFRSHTPTSHVDSLVLVAETTRFRPSDFRRRGPSPFAHTATSPTGVAAPHGDARRKLRAPWLTAGQRVAGLRLTTVHSESVSTRGRTFPGFDLVYGSAPGFGEVGPRSLDISELAHPDSPASWKGIPAGSVRIQHGEESNGRRSFPSWQGQLVKNGIYVTIQTGKGERALIAAARALRPA